MNNSAPALIVVDIDLLIPSLAGKAANPRVQQSNKKYLGWPFFTCKTAT